MKYLKIVFAVLCLTVNVNAMAQSNDESEYQMIQTFASVDQTIYVKAMNTMLRLDTLCSDEVLVTYIKNNKERNKYVLRSQLRTYLTKNFWSEKEKKFKFSAETNNGYVLVIAQYGKDPDLAIRFWTFFIDQTTGKIVVIEIEENN